MNPQIVANHRIASRSAVEFLDYSVSQRRVLKRLELLDDSLPPYFRHYKFPLHSWPWFVGQKMKSVLVDCASRLPELILRAVRARFMHDSKALAGFYGVNDFLAAIFVESERDPARNMCRLDAIQTASGLKVMEVNAGADIGGWQIQWMDGQYRKHPELAPFFAARECHSLSIPVAYLQHLLGAGKASQRIPGGEANILFVLGVEQSDVPDVRATFDAVMGDALAAYGLKGELIFATGFEDVDFRSDGAWIHGKRLTTIVPFLESDSAIPIGLYRAEIRETVYWPGSPFAAILGDKRSLAIVYEDKDRDIFDAEERALIERHVPFSATIAVGDVYFEGEQHDLRSLLLTQRERFVVKVARGARGEGVVVGRHQTAADWALAINEAFTHGAWLAQEYCESLPFYGQSDSHGDGYGEHDVVWGVFGFGRDYGGCWLRLMARGGGDGIINSARGAQETIVYEVPE